ncbi:acyl carrier protein [Streptomyces sp. NBRC 109706]|uniref:acyl carrier protein n=1 Tax=Streptomyces sp. NBRC 109706 TaxID=1550035 RepID=UPI000785444B|nr:acyl carrier protein [Streptomyces sp. NBRC 109706]
MSANDTTAQLDLEDLRAAIAGALDVQIGELTDTAKFVDDLGVDSLMALEVVVVLEKKYGIRFEEQQLRQITSLRSAYEVLQSKLA